ncbi:MAG: hypothetical protein DRJ42_09715 [Deltaproteobacteria bacterium]|nr:MAG: hypothetical protein DRJ42_09715 [Deltaproteobacteria bacterium]
MEEGATSCRTSGLEATLRTEVQVSFESAELLGPAREFLFRVGDYVCEGNRIESGQTMSHGFWVVRFCAEDGILNTYEFDDKWLDSVPGATRALTYWRDQKATCEAVDSDFDPPLANAKAAISAGVIEGDPIEAIRYPAPPHMSGWYLTTARYDGNVESLKVVHLHHVTQARPDLLRHLALPPGSYFDFSKSPKVGFSQEVASEQP